MAAPRRGTAATRYGVCSAAGRDPDFQYPRTQGADETARRPRDPEHRAGGCRCASVAGIGRRHATRIACQHFAEGRADRTFVAQSELQPAYEACAFPVKLGNTEEAESTRGAGGVAAPKKFRPTPEARKFFRAIRGQMGACRHANTLGKGSWAKRQFLEALQ
jgi:hypothetical protein